MALTAYCNEKYQQFIHIIHACDATVWDKLRNLSINTHLWDETNAPNPHQPKRPKSLAAEKEVELANDVKTLCDVEIIRILLDTGLLSKELEKRKLVTLLADTLYSKLSLNAFNLLLEHEHFQINLEELFKEVSDSYYARRLVGNKANNELWLNKMRHLFKRTVKNFGQKTFLYLLQQCVEVYRIVKNQDDLVNFFIENIKLFIYHAEFERNNVVNELLTHDNLNALEICLCIRNENARLRILKILLSQKNILLENKETKDHILVTLVRDHLDEEREKYCQEDLDLLLKHPEVDINMKDEKHKRSILSIAVSKRALLTLQKLLEQPQIDVNMKDNRGWTALHYCASRNLVEMWELLATHPELDFNTKDDDGESPLFKSRLQSDVNPIRVNVVTWQNIIDNIRSKYADSLLFKMLSHPKIDTNIKNTKNQTRLMKDSMNYFGLNNHLEDVLLILSFDNTDVNIQDNQGSTALMYALATYNLANYRYCTADYVLKSQQSIVKAMLKHPKINLDIQDQDGMTACMHSLQDHKHPTYIDIPFEENQWKMLPKRQIEISQYEKFELLTGHELFDINIQDTNGETVFIKAIKNGTFQVFSFDSIFSLLLKQHNLDVNIEDNKGNTALHYLLNLHDKQERNDALEMLATDTRLSDLNWRDEQDNTPIHLFILDKNLASIRIILKNKSISNGVPIDFSMMNKARRDVWDILLRYLKGFLDGEDGNDESEVAKEVLSLAIELHSKDDINNVYRMGKSVLHKITEQGFSKAWREMIKMSAVDVNLRDQSGNTPMMYAAKYLSAEDVKIFLDLKPEIDYEVKNKSGKTVIDIANETGNADLIKCLQIAFTEAKEKHRLENDEIRNIETKMKDTTAAIYTSGIAAEKKELLLLLAGQMEDIISGRDDIRKHSMSSEDRKKITQNDHILCEDLMLEDISHYLIQEGILSLNYDEELQTEKSSLKKNRKFLKRLQCSGPKAYGIFIKGLKDSQAHLAELLENSQSEEGAIAQPGTSGGVS